MSKVPTELFKVIQDSVEHEGPDQGFLYGLENLSSILEAILNPRQEGSVNS